MRVPSVLLIVFSVLLTISLVFSFQLTRRVDSLSKVVAFTQDYQDKYLNATLKANNLKVLTMDQVPPPPKRDLRAFK